MKKIIASFVFGFFSHMTCAQPSLQTFYASVSQLDPEGKLGQIIKQKQIDTPVKGAQAWRIAYISSDVSERKTIGPVLSATFKF